MQDAKVSASFRHGIKIVSFTGIRILKISVISILHLRPGIPQAKKPPYPRGLPDCDSRGNAKRKKSAPARTGQQIIWIKKA